VSDRILTPDDVEAIADASAHRIAEIVTALSTTFGFVDARELAEELGVTIDYVYAHATELGVIRRDSGPKARISFDRDEARRLGARPWRPPRAFRANPRQLADRAVRWVAKVK